MLIESVSSEENEVMIRELNKEEKKDEFDKFMDSIQDWNPKLNHRSTVDFGKGTTQLMFGKQKQRSSLQLEEGDLRSNNVVGSIIREKTLMAFKGGKAIPNKKQVRAIKESSILAFNSNFL